MPPSQTQLQSTLQEGRAIANLIRQAQDAVCAIQAALDANEAVGDGSPAPPLLSHLQLACEVEAVTLETLLRLHYPATNKMLSLKLQDLSHTKCVEVARIWYNSGNTTPDVPAIIDLIAAEVLEVSSNTLVNC